MKNIINILKIISSAAGILVLMISSVSCDKTDISMENYETVPLVFDSPSIKYAVESKASVDGSNFPPSASVYPLGVWIVKGDTYEEQISTFRNMRADLNVGAENEIHWNYYVYNGTKQYDVIYVMKGRKADVYAYHPWSGSVTDIREIPFTSGQSDYMWATPVKLSASDTDTDQPIVRNLAFSHAMTCLEINIRTIYQGTVRLTSMTLTDHADQPRLIASGTMNAVNGELTCNAPVSSITISPNSSVTHQSFGTYFYIIMPAIGDEANPLDLSNKKMELSFKFNKIDGETTFTLPNIMAGSELKAFKRGYKYKYRLVLDNQMDFVPVGVEQDWGTTYVDFEL
jgi:hypothetical protein